MSSFEKHYAGLDITSSDNNGKMRPVSRVTLYVDDENVITAGDDTGLEISAECPNATQAIANTLLARFKGFQYQAMSADDANIDPAVELGDGITADGMYSVIARISDDGSGYVSVSAPGEEELEDEYPMDGPLTRAITQATDRKIAETRSSITKTAEEIRLEVSNTYSTKEELSSSITQTATYIKNEVSATYATKTALSSVEQTANKITWLVKSGTNQTDFTITDKLAELTTGTIKLSVSNGADSSTLTLKSGETTLSSASITFSGLVNFVTKGNLSTSGQTSINGANIQTGTISADKISVTDLSAIGATIGGWTIANNELKAGDGSDNAKYSFFRSPNAGTTWVLAAGGSSTTDINTYPFRVDKNGNLYATNADISGKITVTNGGTIGGWTIENDRLIAGDASGGYTFMRAPKSNVTWVLAAGGHNPDSNITDYKFRVNKNGKVYATDIILTGEVQSGSKLTGTITGTSATISGGTFSGGTISGGTLTGSTGGTFSGGTLSSCNLGGTTLSVASGSTAGFKSSSTGSEIIGQAFFIRTNNTNFTSTGTAFNEPINAYSGIYVNGEKTRVMTTKSYSKRLLDAFETPLPTFSDYGTAALDETGVFYIVIDPIFAETVNGAYLPTVFLTKYGEGDIWVERVTHDIVTVRGTPGLEFAWETRYAQANAWVERMRVMDLDYKDMSTEHDFEGEAAVAYEHSKENIDYAEMGYEYFTEFERSIEAA